MKKLSAILLTFALIAATASAQPPDTLWTRTYGGEQSDCGYGVQQTDDGGFIIAGQTASFGAGGSDAYLIKTDSEGDTVWTRTFGGNLDDVSYSVQQTWDEGYILAGYTYSYTISGCDIYLIKTDAEGDTLWTRTYGESVDDYGRSVKQTADGGYIIAGFTGIDWSSHDVYLIKTNGDGDTLWTRTYGGNNMAEGYDVQQTSDGGYIITGCTIVRPELPIFAVYLIKTNEMGDTTWTQTFNEICDGNFGYSVQQTNDGGYIIAGKTESMLGWYSTIYLIRTDSNGIGLWDHPVGRTYSSGSSVRQTSDQGFIITGLIYSGTPYCEDVYLVKTDANGDTLWTRTYGGDYDDMGNCIELTSDGGFIIAGYFDNYGVSMKDVYLIRLDSEGQSVEDFPTHHPPSFILHPAHPNPFNAETIISFELRASSCVKLAVYDIGGCEVARLIDGWQSAGNHQAAFDASNLPSGVYFARLSAGNESQTRKMLLLK